MAVNSQLYDEKIFFTIKDIAIPHEDSDGKMIVTVRFLRGEKL